jgi:type IV secretory pathway VirB3-like protein
MNKNMKNENLSDLNPTELMKKEKTLKMVLGAYMGILSFLAVGIILLFIQKQNTIALPLLVVLFSSSSIMFMSKKQLNDIKAELGKRGNGEMI